MGYSIDIRKFEKKDYYYLGKEFEGTGPDGTQLRFTNYYLERDGRPFVGISGEFHYARVDERAWEDELIRMKMCGINTIATYVFWIHHEEEEGRFDFSGRRNLREFVRLCQKLGLYVIVRIGPFNHGEARNGGLPDWLYGKPFEVRKLNDGFLFYVRRYFAQIGQQLDGLLFQDGGPVIAAQIDNEYMHSSAPWEQTTGVTNEWVFGGDDGEAYMLEIQRIAKECGILTPFYTCTGWGGAVTPRNMMPLWGGYAYRPWIFINEAGEHSSTEEYVYQDFHNNQAVVTSDFKPSYQPEEFPYACCEMGGGMMNTYHYRFELPYKSVDAMSGIKLASGCNFIGYYMFRGGTNPKSRRGVYLNESQVPKRSYDYQAPIGEYSQIRPSYGRLKTIHSFLHAFGESFCPMRTILPEGASGIAPQDLDTLRFAVRTDGRSGFLFINNFQDHEICRDKTNEEITLIFPDEELSFRGLSLKAEENCILPFHMDLDGIDLVQASAQPLTRIRDRNAVYVFFKPEGMRAEFRFEEGAATNQGGPVFSCSENREAEYFTVSKGTKKTGILCLSRRLADQMYQLSDGTLLFSEGSVLETETGLRIQSRNAQHSFLTWPKGRFRSSTAAMEMPGNNQNLAQDRCQGQVRHQNGYYDQDLFDRWNVCTQKKEIRAEVNQTAAGRFTLDLPDDLPDGVHDAIIRIQYIGDIAGAYIDGELVTDNFCNGAAWEIGTRFIGDRLKHSPLTIRITPLKKGAKVNADSAMAARMEQAEEELAELEDVQICPVYEYCIEKR